MDGRCRLSCALLGTSAAPGGPGKKSNVALFCPLLAQCGVAERQQERVWLPSKGLSPTCVSVPCSPDQPFAFHLGPSSCPARLSTGQVWAQAQGGLQ